MLRFLYSPTYTSIHDYWINHSFEEMDFCWQSNVSAFFNMLSRLVITFIPRSKCPLISWLKSPSAVILEPKKIKSVTISIVSPCFAMKWWDRMPLCWVLSQLLHSPLSLFTFMHWRRKWQPTPVFLPGQSQGGRGLVGCRLWGRTESDTTEAT